MRVKPLMQTLFKILCRTLVLALLAVAAFAPLSLHAAEPAALCEAAARSAAAQTGVPLEVLQAIALTETGRRSGGAVRPWPWAVNLEGAGHWFSSNDEAVAFARTAAGSGATSFDVGCFQINFRWHGVNFPSIEAMFQPEDNALYAARFLQALHDETGDWSLAAGAYHSRAPTRAAAYRKTFDGYRAALVGTSGPPAAEVQSPASLPVLRAAYPLLQGGAASALGSLVPSDAAGTRPLFEPRG